MPLPVFLPKGSASCKRGRNDTICAENELLYTFTNVNPTQPPSFLPGGTTVEDYQDVAHQIFYAIQQLRDDVPAYKNSIRIDLSYTKKIMNKWDASYDPF